MLNRRRSHCREGGLGWHLRDVITGSTRPNRPRKTWERSLVRGWHGHIAHMPDHIFVLARPTVLLATSSICTRLPALPCAKNIGAAVSRGRDSLDWVEVLSEVGILVAFPAFSAPVCTRAVTLAAIVLSTGLTWIQVDLDDPRIPVEPGVYVWVDRDPPHALWYHGNGSTGLRGRLLTQLRWRAAQRAGLEARRGAHAVAMTEQHAFDLARELPAVQQSVNGRDLYCAVARPAPWSVERSDIEPPSSAVEWEFFISAVSLLTVGHRGVIGGGAWETKGGTLGALMTDLAWDRLVDVAGSGW